jgi:4-hydroxy-tetrahydrodipicolinate synthase
MYFYGQLFFFKEHIFMNSLHGVGVALVTPFDNSDNIDFDALAKLIDYTINGGVNYLVSLGTTGETPTLTKEEKLAVLNFTIKHVNNRVPIVAGAGGNDTKKVIEEIKSFPLEKLAAILSACPYYSKPSQEGIYQHYKAIAEAVGCNIILYNVPGRTGRNMEASTTTRLANEFKNIIGTKEAANSITQCQKILRDAPTDFLVLSGDDDLVLSQIGIGMHGTISVIANTLPTQFCGMVHNAMKGNYADARKTNATLIEAYDLLFLENNPAGVKCFLTHQGIIKNNLRLPVVPVSESTSLAIKSYLQASNF